MIVRWLRTPLAAELLSHRLFRWILAFSLAGTAMWLTMQLQGQHWHFQSAS